MASHSRHAVPVVRRLRRPGALPLRQAHVPMTGGSPAQYLPAGLGADQVDIAAAHAAPPFEPVLYPLRHRRTLEHVYYRPQAI
jgi:hypothetical protein